MHCSSCVARVEDALRPLPGIQQVAVSLPLEQALVKLSETTPEMLGSIKQAVKEAGYEVSDAQAASLAQGLGPRLIVAAALTLPVFVISMLHLHFPYRDWLLAALCIPLQFGCAWPFMTGAWRLAKRGQSDMNTLISVGTLAAFLYSFVLTVMQPWDATGGEVYYESQAVIITLILFGRWLEEKAKRRTTSAFHALLNLQPAKARLYLPETQMEMETDVQLIVPGNLLLLKPGDRVPVDGHVVEGRSSIDESMLTGESLPMVKQAGDPLFAGTINHEGRLLFKASRVGSETQLARIIQLVQEAQLKKADVERWVDRIARVFVPTVIIIAMASAAGWIVYGAWTSEAGAQQILAHALTAFVSTLIIACPCALGLATPTAVIAGTGRGAERGILIRGGEVLEHASQIRVILFDKTGTLTQGKPAVKEVRWLVDEHEPWQFALLAKVGIAEAASQHPWAKAISRYCEQFSQGKVANPNEDSRMTDFQEHPGMGISARFTSDSLIVGNEALLLQNGIERQDTSQGLDRSLDEGPTGTRIYFAWQGRPCGYFIIEDALREEAEEAIAQLQLAGYSCVMVTGDREATALQVANQIGIHKVHAQVKPDEKASLVRQIQEGGQAVAMVGDGINDAPALAAANLSLVLGSGTDVALEAGDIILTRNDLRDVAAALRLARQTFWTIKSNLFFAFIYNIIGIPLAAINWLNPMIAAAAMAMSSLSVVGNSLRLRRFQP